MNKDIIGPTNEVTNVLVDLGPRIIMTGSEVLGTSDNISIHVAESTTEELETETPTIFFEIYLRKNSSSVMLSNPPTEQNTLPSNFS